MWTVIHVAQNSEEKDKIYNALTEQGLLVKVRQIGKGKNGQGIFEILVPQSEVDDACIILTSITY
ncbi:hypothetical protein Q428_06980 [Fervidicella metallireducens AeB]|uniref:Glutamate decarboxylase n=1 Tax=Fervidicella metallireducens AeB TaxID=1403537 RepID=A0A017RVJ1_9CLOT|nr:hypothetical protein [Fervidicella metallireducens]EYE88596.1 hypothetical protein Q428_06980 [Fervidicella metallireducens AeB]